MSDPGGTVEAVASSGWSGVVAWSGHCGRRSRRAATRRSARRVRDEVDRVLHNRCRTVAPVVHSP
ncbi:hypothetical protein CLV92_104163 [Kineococcus xinjiangensis]|uniref:Uncharacterized protein n=1 Tax=Kineococcus xinjiangensis TaxID=512762 RepID=A0A2S6ISV8_9ACTN|nr:hypothetical protein CLV92_104163 [Kineococcus xinjiangensis]